jgi:hypothetical protein
VYPKYPVHLLSLVLMSSAVLPLRCQEKWTQVTGIVRSQTGEPPSGVTVREVRPPNPQTDLSGRYTIELPVTSSKFCCVLQFRHEGYKTLTRAVDPAVGVLDIVLEAGESKWVPADWNPSDSKRVGWTMKFAVPKGAKVGRGGGSDAWGIHIGFGSGKSRESMRIGRALNWSSGLPVILDMTNVRELTERDMDCGPNGIDIRGRTKDGRWRFTGMGQWQAGETAGYRNASDGAAKFFDSIIDGLHCVRTPYK